MYIVHATPPANATWPWPNGYFPRKFHYKKEAKAVKDQAEAYGGTATLQKVTYGVRSDSRKLQ